MATFGYRVYYDRQSKGETYMCSSEEERDKIVADLYRKGAAVVVKIDRQ